MRRCSAVTEGAHAPAGAGKPAVRARRLGRAVAAPQQRQGIVLPGRVKGGLQRLPRGPVRRVRAAGIDAQPAVLRQHGVHDQPAPGKALLPAVHGRQAERTRVVRGWQHQRVALARHMAEQPILPLLAAA